jgi:SulP family sulfate permease
LSWQHDVCERRRLSFIPDSHARAKARMQPKSASCSRLRALAHAVQPRHLLMHTSHDRLRKARETLSSDAIAGLTVACVALPLNLALALASGVPASMGIVSGIVAGIVAALLGGVRLQVTGPEAALVPVVYAVALQYGPEGVVLATCFCGLVQIGLGLAKVGAFVRHIPVPVVRGFMAGIGVLILISQLKPLLGAQPGDATSLGALVTGSHAWVTPLLIGAVAAACMASIPAFGALLGLALATALALLIRAEMPRVGVLPDSLPWPRVPALAGLDLQGMLPLALSLTFVASLGSLLAAAAVQALIKDRATQANYDRELIAQGVANLACGLFGGLPVMGAIVRSAVGVQAGARTRASACFHALFLLAALMLGGALVALVPIAGLAGILMLVGVRLLGLPALRAMWSRRRGEVVVIAITAGVIASTTFYVGIAAGLVAAAVLQLVRVGPLHVAVRALRWEEAPAALQEPLRQAGPIDVAEVRGALVFSAAAQLDRILSDQPPWPAHLVLDLRQAWTLDGTALFALQHVLDCLEARSGRFALVTVPSSVAAVVLERSGVAARAVGGACCTSLEQALQAIANVLPAVPTEAHAEQPAQAVGPRQRAELERTALAG